MSLRILTMTMNLTLVKHKTINKMCPLGLSNHSLAQQKSSLLISDAKFCPLAGTWVSMKGGGCHFMMSSTKLESRFPATSLSFPQGRPASAEVLRCHHSLPTYEKNASAI